MSAARQQAPVPGDKGKKAGSKDVFMKIQEIPGESTDKGHPGWIELISFSHGLGQDAGDDRSGAGLGGGKAKFDDVTVLKSVDKATPQLFLHSANAKPINIDISFCKAAGKKTKYLEYKLTDAIISAIEVEGDSGSGVPKEKVSFNYGSITIKYTETDHKTGAPKGSVETQWDLTANVGK